jgi:hypothetical protein
MLIYSQFGEVTDVRFPSLQGSTRRRFCYVQFRTPEQAYQATQLEGRDLGESYRLQAKLSDPTKKLNRVGAMKEGREVVVKGVYWFAHESEVEELLATYGTVESVRIPKTHEGKSKGTAFVVFDDKVCCS